MTINYWAVLACGVISMVAGAIWYGPLFGRKWMEIIGANPDDIEARKKMQKSAGPLYLVGRTGPRRVVSLLLIHQIISPK